MDEKSAVQTQVESEQGAVPDGRSTLAGSSITVNMLPTMIDRPVVHLRASFIGED
jgi:hypothetical protein